MKTNTYKGHLAMLGANIMWGLMSPISKAVLLLGPVSALSLTTFRMLGAAIVFWIASLFTAKEHVSPLDLRRLFFASLFGIVLNQGLFIMGVAHTSPVNSSIVATTTPMLTMIIAAFYLKEPITGKKISGIFVGAIGAMLLILSSRQAVASASGGTMFGDALCLTAEVAFSIYFVVYKGLIGRYSPITLMKWMFTYASICCIPFSYSDVISIDFSSLETKTYFDIAFIVLGSTFLSYLLVPIGQRLLRPTVACMYTYVQPIIASVVAVLWGMDTFGPMKSIAIVLVFLGVYIVTQSKSKAQLDADKAKRESRAS